MKNKFLKLSVICFSVIALLINTLSASAIKTQPAEKTAEVINGIVEYKTKGIGTADIQQWIDSALSSEAGISAEWYIMALSKSGDYDFSSYEKALLKYLSENEIHSATTKQKYALALISAGSTNDYIQDVANTTIGKQGIMSWVFGLHLLNNGYSSSEYTIDDILQMLLSLQLSDGGWAVVGSNSEVDATAMTIQALAPFYNSNADVKLAVDNALKYLSDKQLATGDYSSYGVSNPESTSQVLMAVYSLGIDYTTDNRFIKDNNTLLDGILKYKLKDGSFSHTEGGNYNELATSQVFYCISILQSESLSPYIFEKTAVENTTSTATNSQNATESYAEITTEKTSNSYKLWVCLAVVIIAIIISVILLITKKMNKKNFVFILFITCIAVIVVLITDFKTADDYYSISDTAKENSIGTVTMSITCNSIKDKTDNKYIPKNGIILDTANYSIKNGDTVHDILTQAVKENKIHIETTGSDSSVYIKGINYIYEFDYGDLSGWTYLVNGEQPSVSCGDYQLKNNDTIEWVYSCELGRDL